MVALFFCVGLCTYSACRALQLFLLTTQGCHFSTPFSQVTPGLSVVGSGPSGFVRGLVDPTRGGLLFWHPGIYSLLPGQPRSPLVRPRFQAMPGLSVLGSGPFGLRAGLTWGPTPGELFLAPWDSSSSCLKGALGPPLDPPGHEVRSPPSWGFGAIFHHPSRLDHLVGIRSLSTAGTALGTTTHTLRASLPATWLGSHIRGLPDPGGFRVVPF